MSNPKINSDIIAIMRDIKAIGKDRKNTGQGYNFRGIDDVMNEVHPSFAEHGVFITTTVLDQVREERLTKGGSNMIYSVLKVKFTFHAEDGSNVSCEMIGEGSDTGDKASNKALSVALKYAILQMLMIPTVDAKDPEIDSHEILPKREALPGSKAAAPKLEKKPWGATVWHIPNVCNEGKTYDYKGHTLAEIHLNDPSGFAFWTKTYKPLKNTADQALREALNEAREELARKEAEAPEEASQSAPSDLPENAVRSEMLAELQHLCAKNHVMPGFIVKKAIEFKRTPPETKTVSEFTDELLRSTISNFAWFVTASKAGE